MIEAEIHYDIAKDAWYYVIPYNGTRYVSSGVYRLQWFAKRAARRASKRIKKNGTDWVKYINV